MKYEAVTVKEQVKYISLFYWYDMLFISVLVAIVVGLVTGLICYQAGEFAVCNKLGLVKVETWTGNTINPSKAINYIKQEETK
jgi:hypothetical protein